MRVLGLDLSLTRPGFADDEHGAWAYRTPDLRGAERLIHLRDVVLDLAAGTDLVVVEGYSHASAQQAHQIGELGGLVRVGLFERDCRYVIVQPSSRAKYATGKGNAKKSRVVSAWSARTGVTFEDDNACDAHILWAMGLDAYDRGPVEVPKAQREALRSVTWPRLARGVS